MTAGCPNAAMLCCARCSTRPHRVLLTHSSKWSWLKAWGMRVAQRRGLRRAIVAVARRLAVILHRMWVDGSEFPLEQATAPPFLQVAT